jgi:hypothetical protein
VNNPPAFPIPRHTRHFDNIQGEYVQDDGMTLRDYFAAKAMQGLLASEVNASLQVFAKQAYAVADAMLEARNESQ